MTELQNNRRSERGSIEAGFTALADRCDRQPATGRAGLAGTRDWIPDGVEQVRRRVARMRQPVSRDIGCQVPEKSTHPVESGRWSPAPEDRYEDGERWDGMS